MFIDVILGVNFLFTCAITAAHLRLPKGQKTLSAMSVDQAGADGAGTVLLESYESSFDETAPLHPTSAAPLEKEATEEAMDSTFHAKPDSSEKRDENESSSSSVADGGAGGSGSGAAVVKEEEKEEGEPHGKPHLCCRTKRIISQL